MASKPAPVSFSKQCDLFEPLADRTGFDGSYSKTSPACSPARADVTLLAWLIHWLGPASVFHTGDGATPELLPDRTGFANGLCWTRNTSEFRSGGVACSLSQILETGPVDPRYFLSPRACSGILRRAEKRGRQLPDPLRLALEAVADGEPTSTP